MVTQLNPAQAPGQAITRGKIAKQAQMLPMPLDFTIDNALQMDLPILHGVANVTGIDGAQSIWIDNSDNADNTVIVFSNTFRITCPAFAIGVFPLLLPVQGIKFTATSNGAVLVNTYLTNTREQPAIWSAKFPLSGTINVTGSVINSSVPPCVFTDHSAALGAGDNTVMLANGNRVGFLIKNPATPTGEGIAAPEPLYVSFGSATTSAGQVGTIELLPGETLTAEGIGGVSTQAVHIWSITTGHIVTVKEW